ncbi:MAG: hypothetical protein GXP41_04655, partial [Chloroflexi bacterium]|nr:hypothetical protein [Chloroflexota bacterium]
RYPPPEPPAGGWGIGKSTVSTPYPILVESAGEEVGNLAHIFVNGQDVAMGGRGFNLAVIAPQTGVVTARATFDTHLDSSAAHRLANFVAAVPHGYIVAVAVADEGSRLLSEEAVNALHTLGLAQDLTGTTHFRWSYAALGVKGAPTGSALESASGIRPVRVGAGPAIRETGVTVGVTYIDWESLDAR